MANKDIYDKDRYVANYLEISGWIGNEKGFRWKTKERAIQRAEELFARGPSDADARHQCGKHFRHFEICDCDPKEVLMKVLKEK